MIEREQYDACWEHSFKGCDWCILIECPHNTIDTIDDTPRGNTVCKQCIHYHKEHTYDNSDSRYGICDLWDSCEDCVVREDDTCAYGEMKE